MGRVITNSSLGFRVHCLKTLNPEPKTLNYFFLLLRSLWVHGFRVREY